MVFYLFLFQQADKFEGLGLEKVSRINSQPRTVFQWNPAVHQLANGVGYSNFLNEFMTIAYTIIHNNPLPRIFPEQRNWLQFSEEESIGDWYLFDDYTEIRVYGAEVSPYRLPVFPAMQIYALEYLRQNLKAN